MSHLQADESDAEELFTRPYQTSDFDSVNQICIDTASPYFTPALPLVPYLYSTPYLLLPSTHCLVLVHRPSQSVVGYIIGAISSSAFYSAWRISYTPALPSCPDDTHAVTVSTRTTIQELPSEHTQPELWEEWPAHLHIDLLKDWTGKGWGGRLIRRWLEEVKGKGAQGVHLGVGEDNMAARRFYRREGFAEVKRTEGCVWMARNV